MNLLRPIAILIAATTGLACASLPDPKTCALIGGGFGAQGGVVGGAIHSDGDEAGEGAAIAVGSAVGGAILGYAVCSIFEVAEVAPPPPPPPPAPEPEPEPEPVAIPAPPAPAPEPDPCVEIVALEGVNFETNSAELTSEARGVLAGVIEQLATCPDIAISVGAHTDSMGAEAYNLDLSQKRAASAAAFLVEGGLSAERLQSEGFGESQPIAPNDTAEGRAQNRRVELSPVQPAGGAMEE